VVTKAGGTFDANCEGDRSFRNCELPQASNAVSQDPALFPPWMPDSLLPSKADSSYCGLIWCEQPGPQRRLFLEIAHRLINYR
jgi:hypothetical protein